jgi:hypothetical protein
MPFRCLPRAGPLVGVAGMGAHQAQESIRTDRSRNHGSGSPQATWPNHRTSEMRCQSEPAMGIAATPASMPQIDRRRLCPNSREPEPRLSPLVRCNRRS